MTERGNIKLPAAEFEKHNERRKEQNLSWTEYIDGQAPDATIGDDVKAQLDRIESAVSTPEDEGLYRGSMSDVLADLQDQLDDVKSAAGTAEERTGQIQGTLEDMGARR